MPKKQVNALPVEVQIRKLIIILDELKRKKKECSEEYLKHYYQSEMDEVNLKIFDLEDRS